MRDHDEISEALRSPIASIRTPFTRDGAIDGDGLRAYLERCLAGGARTVLLTYGDSLYSLLTDAEVADVTKIVVDQVAGRAVVVAADRSWWTKKTVEFARYCRDIGADVLMVLPPDWTQSTTPRTLASHYAAVAAEIPVMMVTTYLRSRSQALALQIVEETYQSVPGVLAIKEDVGSEFGRRLSAMVSPRWTVVAGGTKQLHTYLAPYGATGYLSTLAVFRPGLTQRYWQAYQEGNYPQMAAIVRDIDMPMFDVLSRYPGGFDAALHGWCELAGIAGRWRRGPYHSLADGELERLKDELRTLGLGG